MTDPATALAGTIAITTTPAAYGGLERVTVELVRGLQHRGRALHLIVVLEPSVPEPEWVAGLRSDGIPTSILRIAGRDYLGEYAAIYRLIVRLNIAILHTHGYRADLIHARAARRAGIPVVSTVHGFTGRGQKGRFYEWLQCRALRGFDAVVAVSRPIAERLVHAGVAPSAMRTIANGLPAKSGLSRGRAEARAALRLPPSGPVVGWVGRVSSEKGPDIMVRATVHLPPKVSLCVIGDGPELEPTRALARTLGLAERVHFCGALPSAASYLSAFDLLALSSRTEGTPMVILEAARASIPVVATAVGGVPDVLGQDGGWLVPSEDPEALAHAIASALNHPDLSQTRASALLRRLEHQAGESDWIGQYARVYDELIAG